jgi:hypothetical protein
MSLTELGAHVQALVVALEEQQNKNKAEMNVLRADLKLQIQETIRNDPEFKMVKLLLNKETYKNEPKRKRS